MCFKCLFKTGGVCDHLKFTWETQFHSAGPQKEDTFDKFCPFSFEYLID